MRAVVWMESIDFTFLPHNGNDGHFAIVNRYILYSWYALWVRMKIMNFRGNEMKKGLELQRSIMVHNAKSSVKYVSKIVITCYKFLICKSLFHIFNRNITGTSRTSTNIKGRCVIAKCFDYAQIWKKSPLWCFRFRDNVNCLNIYTRIHVYTILCIEQPCQNTLHRLATII